jgi:hypothetical protein
MAFKKKFPWSSAGAEVTHAGAITTVVATRCDHDDAANGVKIGGNSSTELSLWSEELKTKKARLLRRSGFVW